MSTAHIYQIFYDETSRQNLDAGFIPLDNSQNERPDWSEYWVIRQFLLNTPLQENELYGFFSPKFKQKTGLDSAQVFDFIRSHYSPETQVYTFSPFWDAIAYFLNVFEQGEFWHPGLLGMSQEFFDRAQIKVDLRHVVMHSQNALFCNYFVATPQFWRRWLAVGEALFAMAEKPDDVFASQLSGATAHASQHTYPFKVFIQERIVSVLLATESWASKAYGLLDTPHFHLLQEQLLNCDALKQRFTQTQQSADLEEYRAIRKSVGEQYNRAAGRNVFPV